MGDGIDLATLGDLNPDAALPGWSSLEGGCGCGCGCGGDCACGGRCNRWADVRGAAPPSLSPAYWDSDGPIHGGEEPGKLVAMGALGGAAGLVVGVGIWVWWNSDITHRCAATCSATSREYGAFCPSFTGFGSGPTIDVACDEAWSNAEANALASFCVLNYGGCVYRHG